jgi:hypothetical protein
MNNLNEHIGYVPDAKVGDKVWDDLTGTEATVTEVLLRAYKLDNDYLEGYRHSWEVSKTKDIHR